MKRKLFLSIAILVSTLLAGFVIGLTLDLNKGERQTAVSTSTIQSTESKNLKTPNIGNDDVSKQVNQWKVDLNGIGPIRIGMSPREAAVAIATPLVGNEKDNAGCYYIHAKGEPREVRFMIINDHIARIDVDTQEIATISGARVGHTEEQIKAIYPGQIRVERHNYEEQGHYLTLVPNDPQYSLYRIVFETDGKVVTRYRAGKLPEIQWVEGCS